jgi:chemotaxis signal transduction protein
VVAESRQRAQIGQRQDDVVAATTGQQLLLMCAPGGSQAVLPVDSVVRLEQIAASAIEHLGGQEVVQHRGEILPLVRIIEGQWEDVQAGVMAAREHDGETLSVIVFIYRGRRFGLIVEDVVDIIDETQALQEVGCREGVLGSMIVRGHVAELLDIEGLVFAAQRAAAERERLALKAIEEGAAVEPTTAASAGETGTAAVEDSAGEHANAVTERPRKRRSARKASASSAARRVVEPADGDPVEG